VRAAGRRRIVALGSFLATAAALAALGLALSGPAHAAPPDPNTVGSATISNVAINGVAGTVLVVTPGTSVTVTANWADHNTGCPDCIDYLEVSYAGEGTVTASNPSDQNEGGTFTPGGCLESGGFDGSSGSGSADIGPPPSTPGTYEVVAQLDESYWCGEDWSTTGSASYTVIAQIEVESPPTATISSPQGGGTYAQGASAPTSFSCGDPNGPGIQSCTDNNGGSGSSGTLNTSTPGANLAYTVTALSSDGQSTSTTIHYTVVGPPTATITSPSDDQTYTRNQVVPTTFSCADATSPAGPGIQSCTDNNGGSGSSGTLNTSATGYNLAYTVTALSSDGQSTSTTIHYSVVDGPPAASITTPADHQTYNEGQTVDTAYACGDPNGPGIQSCTDNNGGSGSSGTLNTSTPGANLAYTVTALSSDGQSTSTTIHYTVIGPPTATITSPSDDQTYTRNQVVPTTFSCADATSPNGPGIQSCTDNNGSSSPSGTLTTSSTGNNLAYTVTALSSDGQSTTTTIHYSVVNVAPQNTALPVISGTVQEGQALSVSTGTWTGDPAPTYTYQWEQCDLSGLDCTNLSATTSGYVPTASDVGHTLRVTVTATNPAGAPSATSQPTAAVLIAAPANDGAPTITGVPQQDQTLTAGNGTWTNSPTGYGYQWWRCDSSGANCAVVSGATNATYPLAAADVGATLRVVVTASNNGGHTSAQSPASAVIAQLNAPASTAAPEITGTAQQGANLSADTGTWTNAPDAFAYQWLRCDSTGASCSPISAATSADYTPTAADVGSSLRVVVTAANATGGTPATSPPTGVVEPAAPVNSLAPSISGTAQQGDMLDADTGFWSNGVTGYAYQWLQCDATGANCTEISGADASSYVPSSADVGHTLQVTVTASNSGGHTAATSAATALVAAPAVTNPPAELLPPPSLDSSTNLTPVTGTILVKLPGSNTFTSVPQGTNVPIGSTVDAISGTVSITFALPDGTTETGEFYSGEFKLTQAPDGTAIPVLTGGSFSGCPSATTTNGARAAGASKKKKPGTVVRQLWGNAHGDYTTKGRYGSASVSGTIWLVQDRCDGTYIYALKDDVFVIAYAHPHHRYHILQGHHILIPPPGS
jgi:hypothetical protein